ncbi:unnamed protein product [Ixodes persulcatus]
MFTNIVKIRLVTPQRVPLNPGTLLQITEQPTNIVLDSTKSMHHTLFPRASTVPKLSRRPCRVSFRQKPQFPKTVERFFRDIFLVSDKTIPRSHYLQRPLRIPHSP